VFGAAVFTSCVLYGLAVPSTHHLTTFLEITLPGFRWLSPSTFLLGLAETFLYGAYAGLLFAPIYNFFCRRFAGAPEG
jgi:hypothetical protein